MSKQDITKRRQQVLIYYQDIVYYLGKFGLDEEDLKDAINETFITAYEKVGTLRDEDAMRSWLLTIARNIGLQRKKSHKMETPVDFIETLKDCGANDVWEEDVADGLIRDADTELLNKCLSRLNEREYRIITLQYVYDEKLKDIALITGESLNNVKSISRRSKAKLKQYLIEGGYTRGR